MNTTEILNKSLAWLYCVDQEINDTKYDIGSILSSLEKNYLEQFTGLEIAEGGEIRSYYRYSTYGSFNTAVDEVNQVAPEEVYILTQVILNTLNIDPDRFHNMFEIPGLETEGWEQLAKVAHYLIKEGWIEPKAVEEKLLVKLTMEGKIYLRNNNAWS